MFYIIVSIGIVIAFTLPLIRLVGKRIILLIKLKRLCTRKNIQLIPTHLCWFLGSNRYKNTDVYIVTKRKVYSVKLFSVLERRSHLVFTDDIHYFIRSFRLTVVHFYYSHDHRGNLAKLKTWIDYDMKYKYNSDWYMKDFEPILLVNPVCWEITKVNKFAKEETLGSGDIINNMFLYTADRFIDHIEF